MKIAICSDQFPPMRGGVPDVLTLLVDGLFARGHEVRVFAPDLSGALADSRVRRIPTIAFAEGAAAIVSPFSIRARLEEFNPDVVHLHSVGLLVIAASRAARRLGIPRVITYHGDMSDYLYVIGLNFAPVRSAVDSLCARYFGGADIVTAPAQLSLRYLRAQGVVRPLLEHVPNPIDTTAFAPTDKAAAKKAFDLRGNTVGIFGRISREKNLGDAIKAFERVAKRIDATFVVIGDGPYRKEFESLVREAGLGDRTRYLGYLSSDRLVSAVSACDLMLAPGLVEVQPLAVLQSLACGVPVIGMNSGGMPECIKDGETGFVLEPHDIDGYAERIERLMDDNALRERFSAAAVREAAHFSRSYVSEQYEAVYARAIRAHGTIKGGHLYTTQ